MTNRLIGISLTTWMRIFGVLVFVSFAFAGWSVIRVSKAEAERTADRRAANTAQVARCFQQVRDLPDVVKVLDLVDQLASNSIAANRQALRVAPKGDPLRSVRVRSLRRLVPARARLHAFSKRTQKNVPSEQQCLDMAETLDVNPDPLKKR